MKEILQHPNIHTSAHLYRIHDTLQETKWYAQRVQPSLVFDADLSKSHPLYAYNGPEFDSEYIGILFRPFDHVLIVMEEVLF